MKDSLLLEGEFIITQTPDNSIVVTNKRIRHTIDKDFTSIAIHKISCIKINYTENVIFMAIGLLLIFCGTMVYINGSHNNNATFSCGLLGAASIAAYFLTRRHVVSIISDSGEKIQFHTKGISNEDILSFVNKIERVLCC